ncbi:hypothetical protein [Nonomuraea africana]|uniref:Uncharacterized protein n=1 Tax=Nonomuraea africana TaxID=46171 RepID=A0ABR9KHT3_9ACTN|nr:hypothetical protein [Nonomuraea africana]MBE1561579.1 hypothetical protein [Nonomuraea africana]
MTRRLRRRALSLCVATIVSGLPVVDVAHAEPARPPIEAWQRSTSVRLSADSSLTDVDAVSADEVWAVGQQQIWDVWENRGAVGRWNGTAWTEVPIRDVSGAGPLRSVSAVSASQVWALGDGHDGLPYLGRGDASGLDRVRVPGMRAGDWFGGLEARTDKVVAAGSRDGKGLILTGQNGKWTFQQTEEKGALYAVAGPFAVGDTGKAPLVMRQVDGKWTAMALPPIPGGYLRDIHVDGKRAMAVGGVYGRPGVVEPLVLTWNGKRWHRAELPRSRARLYGVTGDGKGRFWVSGYDPDHESEAYLLRYEKKRWEIIRGGPDDARGSVRLQAVTYLPGAGGVWAVGHVVDANDRYTDVVEAFARSSAK